MLFKSFKNGSQEDLRRGVSIGICWLRVLSIYCQGHLANGTLLPPYLHQVFNTNPPNKVDCFREPRGWGYSGKDYIVCGVLSELFNTWIEICTQILLAITCGS